MTTQSNAPEDQSPRHWSSASNLLGGAAVALLVCLSLLTCIDVVARYWFNKPVNGAFELTQLLLAGLIFLALPITTSKNEHVEVDLLADLARGALRRFIDHLALVATSVTLLLVSWRLWHHAEKLAEDGAVTNSLAIAYAPVGYLAALSCFVSGIIALALSWSKMQARRKDAQC